MGVAEMSDEELEKLQKNNLEEAVKNYQEQAASEACFKEEHVTLLGIYVALSNDKLKRRNVRRQTLAVLAAVSEIVNYLKVM